MLKIVLKIGLIKFKKILLEKILKHKNKIKNSNLKIMG